MKMLEKMARQLSPVAWQSLNTPCDTKARKKRRETSLEYAKRCINALREPDGDFLDILHQNVFSFGPLKGWDGAIDFIVDEDYFRK